MCTCMCICMRMYMHMFTSILISTLYILNTEFTSIPLIPTQGVKLSLPLLLYIFVTSFLNSKKNWFPLSSTYLFIFSKYLLDMFNHLLDIPVYITSPNPLHRLLHSSRCTFPLYSSLPNSFLTKKEEGGKKKRKKERFYKCN